MVLHSPKINFHLICLRPFKVVCWILVKKKTMAPLNTKTKPTKLVGINKANQVQSVEKD